MIKINEYKEKLIIIIQIIKMQIIKNLIKNLFNKEPTKLLGRWNIDYCERMNIKIDLSNMDNSSSIIKNILDKNKK
jgi:hypothetical protein